MANQNQHLPEPAPSPSAARAVRRGGLAQVPLSMLDRKLLREIGAHWAMLAAVAGIIAVGVSCLAALGSSYLNLAEAKALYYGQCRMADFSVELKKAPVSEVAAIAAMPGIAQLRTRIQQYVTVDLEHVAEPVNGLVLSLPDRRQPIINDIVIRQGGYFTDRRDNEVIVAESFAQYHKLRPGMWIRLILNNRQQELMIVGTAISSEFVYLLGAGSIVPDPKRFGVFYIKHSYAEEAFDFRGSTNQVLGRLSPGADRRLAELLRRIEQRLESYGVFTTTPLADQLSNRFLSQEIQGLHSFAIITPTMFLAVAALVLSVLLSRLAQQQRTVVGTLKALGYSDSQLLWHFLKLGLLVGLCGGLAGCLLGWYLAGGMTAIYRRFFQFPELTNRFHFRVYAIGLVVSVGCALAGSIRGCRAVLRLSPAEAMRPQAPRGGGAIILERVGWLWRRLGFGLRMVLRNLFRNRVRTAASIFAAAMGGSVLVTGFMMQAAPEYLIDFQFRRVLRSDYDLGFVEERGLEALDESRRLPGVNHAEPVLSVACTFCNGPYRKKGSITALSAEARLTVPRDMAARPIRIPAAGLALSRQLADSLRVRCGQWLTVEPIKGQRRPFKAQVVEISDSYLGTAVYAEIGYLSRLVGEQMALNGVQLAVDGDRRHTSALHKQLKELPALQSLSGRADMIRSLEETVLGNQRIVIGLLVLFAGVVFFGSIFNASLVSLAERQREVATLRVLGYGPWHVGSLFLCENMITTVLGTVAGMPLGYLLTLLVAWAYASDMFRLPVVAAPGLWASTMFWAIVFALGAHLFVQRAINRMDWLAAVKVQE